MTTRTQIYREVLREYEQLRAQEEADLRERKETLYQMVPRLRQIEQELSLTGVESAKAVLLEPAQAQEHLLALQEKGKVLHAERNTLLQSVGASEQMLKPYYRCNQCKDTGYVDQEMCACMKKRIMERLYDQSNVKELVKTENFNTFRFDYYSDQRREGQELSPRENMQQNYKKALDFTRQIEEGASLLLWGPTGLGKTFLCNAIAKGVLEQGKVVLYFTSGQLCRLFEAYRFGAKDEYVPKVDPMEDLLDADLLIIDDLGTEFSTVLTASELFRVINERALRKKSVVLSTNLGADKLVNQYSDRFLSRVRGTYEVMAFYGEDIRIRKKYEK